MERFIRQGGIKHRLLELLYHCHLLQRKMVHLALLTRQDRNCDMLRDLVGEEFVKIVVHERVQCVCLTNKGLAAFYRLEALDPDRRDESYTFRPDRLQRELVFGHAAVMLHAAGVHVFEGEKPSIETMIALMNGTEPKTETDIWADKRPKVERQEILEEMLAEGIFYPSGVIKKLLRSRETAEIVNKARFIGIILATDDAFMVYSLRNHLITCPEAPELEAWRAFIHLLEGYEPYRHLAGHIGSGKPKALVFGKDEQLIPELTSGYTGGVNRSPKRLAFRKRLDFLSAKSPMYERMYFAPVNRAGVEQLKEVDWLPMEGRLDRFEQVVANSPGLSIRGRRDLFLAEHESSVGVGYLPFCDLTQLRSYREMKPGLIVYLHKELADGVAKALGPILDKAVDIKTNREVPTARYTIKGALIDEAEGGGEGV